MSDAIVCFFCCAPNFLRRLVPSESTRPCLQCLRLLTAPTVAYSGCAQACVPHLRCQTHRRPKMLAHRCTHRQTAGASKDASAGNQTRVTSMATMYSTTRPLMPLSSTPGATYLGGQFTCIRTRSRNRPLTQCRMQSFRSTALVCSCTCPEPGLTRC